MLNQPPAPGIPGMSDTLDFVKNLWGSMNVPGVSIPGMATPALTTEELDKKIADLKAVEAWLNLNGTMLRGTIQTLEVQRGTVAALQSMGASFAQAMKAPGDAKPAAGGQSSAADAAMPAAVAWWNLLEEQFRQAVTSAMSPEAMKGAAAMAEDSSASRRAPTAEDSDKAAKARNAKPKPDKS